MFITRFNLKFWHRMKNNAKFGESVFLRTSLTLVFSNVCLLIDVSSNVYLPIETWKVKFRLVNIFHQLTQQVLSLQHFSLT